MRNLFRTEKGKAQFYFILTVFVNIVVLSIIATGIGIGIKGYIFEAKSTYESITCCGSICSKCFFTLHTLTTIIPWICMAIFLIGIWNACYKASFLLFYNHNFTRSHHPSLSLESHPGLKDIMHSVQIDNQLILLNSNGPCCAFTLGMWKPRIYLSLGICSYLTREELLAVILHEVHHKNSKDPLKLFIIKMLCSINFFLPINRYLLNQFSSASEKAADDSAVNLSKEPLDLASALVKMCRSHDMTTLHPVTSFFKGESIVEDRIKRLLTPESTISGFKNTCWYISCFLSFFIAAAICMSLFYKPLPHAHAGDCKAMICHMSVCER